MKVAGFVFPAELTTQANLSNPEEYDVVVLGSRVTVVDRNNTLAHREDRDVSEAQRGLFDDDRRERQRQPSTERLPYHGQYPTEWRHCVCYFQINQQAIEPDPMPSEEGAERSPSPPLTTSPFRPASRPARPAKGRDDRSESD